MPQDDELWDGDDELWDGDDEADEDDYDCGMCFDERGNMLGCTKAGSEECDWECPYLASFERLARRRRGGADAES